MGKTGTTSIQLALLKNREQLGQHGFLVEIGQDTIAEMVKKNVSWHSIEGLDVGIDAIKRKLTRSGLNNLVWSWESFSTHLVTSHPENLQRLKRGFPGASFKIIVYLRRQDLWLQSAYPQWAIKDKQEEGPVLSFREWYDQFRQGGLRWWRPEDLDYYALLTAWGKVFGRDNLIIRVFETDQLEGGDVVFDFFEHSGVPQIEYDTQIERVNQTWNMELLWIVAKYNSLFPEAYAPEELLLYLADASSDPFFKAAGLTRFRVPQEIAFDVLSECEAGNRAVAMEFLGRDNGVLFHPTLQYNRVSETDSTFEGMSLERVVPILLHLLLQKHQRVQTLEKELQSSRKLFKDNIATQFKQLDNLTAQFKQREIDLVAQLGDFTNRFNQLEADLVAQSGNFTTQFKQLEVDLVEKFRLSNRVRSIGRYILRQIFSFVQR